MNPDTEFNSGYGARTSSAVGVSPLLQRFSRSTSTSSWRTAKRRRSSTGRYREISGRSPCCQTESKRPTICWNSTRCSSGRSSGSKIALDNIPTNSEEALQQNDPEDDISSRQRRRQQSKYKRGRRDHANDAFARPASPQGTAGKMQETCVVVMPSCKSMVCGRYRCYDRLISDFSCIYLRRCQR